MGMGTGGIVEHHVSPEPTFWLKLQSFLAAIALNCHVIMTWNQRLFCVCASVSLRYVVHTSLYLWDQLNAKDADMEKTMLSCDVTTKC